MNPQRSPERQKQIDEMVSFVEQRSKELQKLAEEDKREVLVAEKPAKSKKFKFAGYSVLRLI